jgi:NAD(P)-dependent dehydrogenase (short-subunit alcohol dehydrogenase family)
MSLPHYTKANHTTSYPSISPTLPVLSTAGKTIFITGGGSGLGPHLGQAFALSGTTKVTIIGRTASSLLSTKASIEDKFPCLKVLTFVADITSPTAVTSAFEATKKEFGPINILVSNAGQMSEPSEIGKADVDTWFQGFETNVKGALILTQAFLANCSEKAVLINITSGGAHIPANPLGFSSYATSKLAAAKMMEYVGVENPNVRLFHFKPHFLVDPPPESQWPMQSWTTTFNAQPGVRNLAISGYDSESSGREILTRDVS